MNGDCRIARWGLGLAQGSQKIFPSTSVALCLTGGDYQGISWEHMEGTEPRLRRLEGCSGPEVQGLSGTDAEDGLQGAPEVRHMAPKPPDPEPSRETAWTIGLQVAVPFLCAGVGLSWAGVLLDYFQVRGNPVGMSGLFGSAQPQLSGLGGPTSSHATVCTLAKSLLAPCIFFFLHHSYTF